jgi:hypothetical protein
VLTHIVERCCRLKADVVEKDEREETGLRAILNYGHTFCHAFEAATGYEALLHGEGVAIGMMCAARLAQRLGRVDAAFVERQRKLLESLGLPLAVPNVAHDELIELMYHDKKAEHGKLRFVLPSRLGHVGCARCDEDIEAVGRDELKKGEPADNYRSYNLGMALHRWSRPPNCGAHGMGKRYELVEGELRVMSPSVGAWHCLQLQPAWSYIRHTPGTWIWRKPVFCSEKSGYCVLITHSLPRSTFRY